MKGTLTVITFGIKLPAGIFIPTLGVGACCGRIVGVLIQAAEHRLTGESKVVPGVYAMVGAAAALSGATVRCSFFMYLIRRKADDGWGRERQFHWRLSCSS